MVSPLQLSSLLWHHQSLPSPSIMTPARKCLIFAGITEHARTARQSVWSESRFCFHISAVWPLILTRELLVIYRADQRAVRKTSVKLAQFSLDLEVIDKTCDNVRRDWTEKLLHMISDRLCSIQLPTPTFDSYSQTAQFHLAADRRGVLVPIDARNPSETSIPFPPKLAQ